METSTTVCTCAACRAYRDSLRSLGKRGVEALSSPLCEGLPSPSPLSATAKRGQRNIFVPQAEWEAVKAEAARRGLSTAAFVRAALTAALSSTSFDDVVAIAQARKGEQ